MKKISLSICVLIVSLAYIMTACVEEIPKNNFKFNSEGIFSPDKWFLIGPFTYDTLTQHSDSTFFNQDLEKYGVDEFNFKKSDINVLISKGLNPKLVDGKHLINNFRSMVDTFRMRSNIYLATTVFCEDEQNVFLMLDGAAAFKIIINQDLIYEERDKESMRANCDRFIKVKLNKGENLIFAKVNRELNYYAWGINVAFANENIAKEIFYANYYCSYATNPIVNDTISYYSGPLEVLKAEIIGNGVQKDLQIYNTYNHLYNGYSTIDSLKLNDGFYYINLYSSSDTLKQLIYKGDLCFHYNNLVEKFENSSSSENIQKEYYLLKSRIISLYQDFDERNWRKIKHTNTNLIYWVQKLDILINNYSKYTNTLAIKNSQVYQQGLDYEYAFFLDSSLSKNKSIPLIVVVPFAIDSDSFSTSWYLSNYEQLWIDCKLAKDRGYALCYLFGQGSDYSSIGLAKEFISVLESIENEFPQVNTDKVYLTGTCEGGARALVLATNFPQRIKALGLKTPVLAFNYPELSSLKDVPILINYGIYDHVIQRDKMRRFVKYLSRNVDEIKYVELEEGHESLRKDENRLIYDYFNEHNR